MTLLLHQLLSDSARRFPDKEALVFEDQTISYSQLESQTNLLASQLLKHGIQKGSLVGIHMNRSILSITAACAILKTGAAYVPIDPLAPIERIQYIITKCKIKSLITLENRLSAIEKVFPDYSPLENIVVMDGTEPVPGRQDSGSSNLIFWHDVVSDTSEETSPSIDIAESDLAYILFTSGSTGNPKGVMISHLNSLTFVNSACDIFQISHKDRLSNNSPLHFDLSVFDLFVAFKAGATVVIVPEAISIFPVRLAQFIDRKNISVWNSVPSALSLLATYEKLSTYNFDTLRLILFAGEVFPLNHLRKLQKAIPAAQYFNIYGQTEANSSLYYHVKHLPADDTDSIPIGKPFPDFDVFALDETGKVIEHEGERGELYVSGQSVALGYWDEKRLTEASFVRNPLTPEVNTRAYKTGDLVTLDTDSNFLFLGRTDHMIKSRGYRVEIGEIETVIASHKQVKNIVVVPIPDELVGNRLAAVIVPLTESGLTKEEIIQHCLRRLPKYMVPETIDFRTSLFMTSSGKIDRKKLAQEMGRKVDR